MKQITTKIIAHRGASGLVKRENTLEAFQKAIEINADGIELDIRKTKDNIICVHHDPNIGDLIISEHSYVECLEKSLSLGYHIPTLKETLELCHNQILLDIEFKESGYEKEALDLILEYYKENEFFVRSFYYDVLINIKKINPNIYTFLLVGNTLKPFKKLLNDIFPSKMLKVTHSNAISPNRRILILGYILRMKLRKTPMSIWTVNNEKDIKKLLKKNVAYIISDYPDRVIRIKNELNNK